MKIEHKIKAVFERNSLENSCADFLLEIIYDFHFLNFYCFWVFCLIGVACDLPWVIGCDWTPLDWMYKLVRGQILLWLWLLLSFLRFLMPGWHYLARLPFSRWGVMLLWVMKRQLPFTSVLKLDIGSSIMQCSVAHVLWSLGFVSNINLDIWMFPIAPFTEVEKILWIDSSSVLVNHT